MTKLKFEMKCEVCGTSPLSGGYPIFRTGGKGAGINPHWRCQQHSEIVLDQETVEIVNIIDSTNRK